MHSRRILGRQIKERPELMTGAEELIIFINYDSLRVVNQHQLRNRNGHVTLSTSAGISTTVYDFD